MRRPHCGSTGTLSRGEAPKGFTAYGVSLGDDPVAKAMKGIIDHTAGHEHQIAMLWKAIEKLSNDVKDEDCVPNDAQKAEDFSAKFPNIVIQNT